MLAQIVGIATGKQAGAFTSSMLKELRLMGISLTDKSLVRSPENIRPIIGQAIGANDLVFVLLAGDPHTDKLVCESICNTFGVAPQINPGVKEAIRSYLISTKQTPTQEQLSRAQLPQGAIVFPNNKGIQPAYAVRCGNRTVMVLPGDKRELNPIFVGEVLPILAGIAPRRTFSHLVSCYSLPAMDAEKQLGSLLGSNNPIVTLYSMGGGCVARVSATGSNEKQAKDAAQLGLKTVASRLGAAASAIDAPVGLENALAQAAAKNRLTLALAEIAPRPILSLRLSRNKRLGGVIQPPLTFSSIREAAGKLGLSTSQISAWGEHSQQTAAAAAQAARKRYSSHYGAALLAPRDMYQPGKIFIAVASDKTVWIKGYTVNPSLGADYQLEYCAEELLCLYWQVVSAHPKELPDGQSLSKLLGKSMPAPLAPARSPAAATSTAMTVSSRPLPTAASGKGVSAAVAVKSQPKAKPDKSESIFQKIANVIIPQKGDDKIDIFRKIVLILCIIVFTGSMSYLVNNKVGTMSTRNMYEGLSSQMYDPETDKEYVVPNAYPQDYQLKFAKLWEQNSDIVGYINIPGTTVNYPVVQTTEKDSTGENYYHRRDFTRAANAHGTPYADYESDIKRPSEQILIYGHNMTDGLMFGEVDKYKNLSFYQQAPVINFDSVYKNGQYKIFSVFITNSLPQHGTVFNYHKFINAKDKADYDQYINEVRSRSLYDIPVDVEYGDELLTLSTCNYYYNGIRMFEEARLVVVARRVRDRESAEVDVSAVTMNEDAKFPDAWYTVMNTAKQKASEAIDSVTIGGERTINMEIGQTQPLSCTISPTTATNKKVTWSSSNGEVAVVDNNGVITAVGGGTAAITVTTQAGGEKTDSIKVVVNAPTAPDLSDISLNKNKMTLLLGDTDSLRVSFDPAGAYAPLIWDSSDWNAVRVSDESEGGQKVLVSGKELATGVVVSVTTQDGSFYDECIINVVDPDEEVSVEDIYLDEEDITLEVGARYRLRTEIYPDDATNQNVRWSTSDSSIAAVDNGRVTGVAPGHAVITATTQDGDYTAECTVTVTGQGETPPSNDPSRVNGISLDMESLSLIPGDSYGLSAAVSPPEAEDQRIDWSSSDTSVATVNNQGKVRAVGGGTARITATSRDGGYTAACEVLVQEDNANIPVDGISVNRDTLDMEVGDGRSVTASVSPTDATDQRVDWSSSDTSVATVSDGSVQAVGPGTAIITATTRDGEYFAEVKVTVTQREGDPEESE